MKSLFSAALTAAFSAQVHALGAGKVVTDLNSLMANRTVMLVVAVLFIGAALIMWMQNCKCCSMLNGGHKHRKSKKHSSKSPARSSTASSKANNSSSSSLRRSPRKSKAVF